MYMAGPEVQKERAIKGSYNPTLTELYKDPDIKKANPFMGSLVRTFSSAVARPTGRTGTRYNQVSSEFQNTVHEVLSKSAKPEEAIARLNTRLHQISRGGKW
jgi:trehalose/maltose transport system substrate-binding protein